MFGGTQSVLSRHRDIERKRGSIGGSIDGHSVHREALRA